MRECAVRRLVVQLNAPESIVVSRVYDLAGAAQVSDSLPKLTGIELCVNNTRQTKY